MPDSNAVITRSRIIQRAFRRVGKFNPTTQETALSVELLNMIVKNLDEEGRWLWAINNTPTNLNLVAGTQTYSVGTVPSGIANNILKLENFELVQGANLVPLQILTKTEAVETALRESNGTPSAVYLETATNMLNQKIWVYTNPTSNDTAQYYYRRRLYDFDNANDNPDFPQDWGLRIIAVLTFELSKEYGGINPTERELMRADAENAINQGIAANANESADPTYPLKTIYY